MVRRNLRFESSDLREETPSLSRRKASRRSDGAKYQLKENIIS